MKTNFDNRVLTGKEEWLTPRPILSELGEFDLDPCSPIDRPWPTAKNHFTIVDNGLIKQWSGRVWLNPPYGNQTGRWLKKMADHNNGIALIFARTETVMFFDYVWNKADSILFLKGRLSFFNIDGSEGKSNAGAPSVLVAYGAENSSILEKCNIEGVFVTAFCPKNNNENSEINTQQTKLAI